MTAAQKGHKGQGRVLGMHGVKVVIRMRGREGVFEGRVAGSQDLHRCIEAPRVTHRERQSDLHRHTCLHSMVHTFHGCFLSTYCVPGSGNKTTMPVNQNLLGLWGRQAPNAEATLASPRDHWAHSGYGETHVSPTHPHMGA